MPEFAVWTSGLTKRYGDVLAVDGVELRVERGEIYGFLGLNGAGKTTTIRLLLGMVRPSAGRAEVLGESVGPRTRSLWRRVGHLVEAAVAYPELTVRENLEVARELQGLQDRSATARAIERLGLEEYSDRRARHLSAGNLQRLALARALLHDPELLVLDEPANGLDPAGVVAVRHLLQGLVRERGVTVFMSSHILPEVDRLATRIGIVHHGKLVEELSADELERRRRRRIEVVTRDLDRAEGVLRQAGFEPLRPGGTGRPVIELVDERALNRPDDVAELLVRAGVPPLRLAMVQEDIEAHFLDLVGADEGGRA
jgi:ABC-2 type transport system ATP-binding protein